MVAHREGLTEGFTKTHGVRRLVYVEHHLTIEEAFAREKRVKRWRRAWKIQLIERFNPTWRDLAEEWW